MNNLENIKDVVVKSLYVSGKVSEGLSMSEVLGSVEDWDDYDDGYGDDVQDDQP